MDNINCITATVLINKILDGNESDFARAIINGFVLNDSDISKTPIKIIFSENNEARRTKGLKPGDILYIYGNIGYTIDDKIIIYATSFIVLSKNTADLTPKERKLIFLSYQSLPNNIFLEGTVTNAVSKKKILVNINRDKYIRGEIKERDVIPCLLTNNIELSNSDNILIQGFIKDNKLYGNVKKIL